MADLTPDDAAGLLELADRCSRAAKTARETTSPDPMASDRLHALADYLDGAARSAGGLAAYVTPPAPPPKPMVPVPLTCGHDASVPEDETGTLLFWCPTCRALRDRKKEADDA